GSERVLVVQRGDGTYSYRRQWRADIRTEHPDSPLLVEGCPAEGPWSPAGPYCGIYDARSMALREAFARIEWLAEVASAPESAVVEIIEVEPPGRRVTLSFDADFADRLFLAALNGPVWLAESPANRATAKRIWANAIFPSGRVTIFDTLPELAAENAFAELIDDIDLHHPGWIELEVVGLPLGPSVHDTIAELGGCSVERTDDGFRLRR
ncbi:MAG: hypothetical protein AB7O97_24410, partial [Planctomycetota bacterium]